MATTEDSATTFRSISDAASRYIKLLVEDTRLSVAEKLTRMFSAIALCALLTIISTVALVFISIAVALALAEALDPLWSFIIVAGFYIALLVILVCCRTSLIVTPIARFISRLLLPAPQKKSAPDDQPASLPQ